MATSVWGVGSVLRMTGSDSRPEVPSESVWS